MQVDLRRFQFLLGTPCECQNVTYVDDDGNHIAQVSVCPRCWEVGMMMLAAECARQLEETHERELDLQIGLNFEVDRIAEPTAPLSPEGLPHSA